MKKLVYFILGVLCSFSITPAYSKTHSLSAADAKQVEANYNKLAVDGQTWELQRDQAFKVELNSGKLKDVVFAPFKGNTIQLVLTTPGGRSIVQTLPKSDLAVVNIFSFSKVDAVSFKDINGDGTRDILVLSTYFDSRPVQGEGVGGGTTKVGFAFVSHKDKYTLNEACGENVASIAELEKCLRENLTK